MNDEIPLRVARTGKCENGLVAVELELDAFTGRPERRVFESNELVPDYGAIVKWAASRGVFSASHSAKIRALLRDASRPTFTLALTPGWKGESYSTFVTPNGVYSDSESDLVLSASLQEARDKWSPSGTLREWQSFVEWASEANTLVPACLCIPFLAVLMPVFGLDPTTFVLVGRSSAGKTSISYLVASVNTKPPLEQWLKTPEQFEKTYLRNQDNLVIFDDVKTASRSEKERCEIFLDQVFRISGRTTKERFRGEDARPQRVVLLTTSNQSVATMLERIGRSSDDKEYEVRAIELPMPVTHSAFENVPAGLSGRQFADRIRKKTDTFHGTAGDLFLRRLFADRGLCETMQRRLLHLQERFVSSLGNLSPTDGRKAAYFGALWAAGWLARSYDILSIDLETLWACLRRTWHNHCNWVSGGSVASVVLQYVQTHAHELRRYDAPLQLSKEEVAEAPGFTRKIDGKEMLAISAERFAREFDRSILDDLKAAGALLHDIGKLSKKQPIRGGHDADRDRVYLVNLSALKSKACALPATSDTGRVPRWITGNI